MCSDAWRGREKSTYTILNSVEGCSVLVGFLSPTFVESKWCIREITYATLFWSLLRIYLFNKSVFGSTYLIGLFIQLLLYVVGDILVTYGVIPYISNYLPLISYGDPLTYFY